MIPCTKCKHPFNNLVDDDGDPLEIGIPVFRTCQRCRDLKRAAYARYRGTAVDPLNTALRLWLLPFNPHHEETSPCGTKILPLQPRACISA
jgi:hypothetical protein